MLIKPDWPRIRETVSHGNRRWTVDARPVMPRKQCESREDAEEYRAIVREQVSHHGATAIPVQDHADTVKARKMLEPYGISILKAVEICIEKMMHDTKIDAAPVMEEALDQWEAEYTIAEKKKECSNRTAREIRLMSKVFKKAWKGRKPGSITPAEIRSWLLKKPVTKQTRVNIRTKLSQFFNWARVPEWVKVNPCELVEFDAGPREEVEILTIEECKKLLEAAEGTSVEAYVLVGLFAGLRPGEAQGLLWSDLVHNQIKVRAETSKTRRTRYVKIDPRLWRRLMQLKGTKKEGFVKGKWFPKIWTLIRKKAGWMTEGKPWPDNALRHSHASYWLPIHSDINRLAENMGNSPEVIKEDYQLAIPMKDAKAFWRLLK